MNNNLGKKVLICSVIGVTAAAGVVAAVLINKAHFRSVLNPEPDTVQELKNAKDWWHQNENKTFFLHAKFPLPKRLQTVTPRQLGIRPDYDSTIGESKKHKQSGTNKPQNFTNASLVKPVWTADFKKANRFFRPLRAHNKPAVNARIKFVSGKMYIKPEKAGSDYSTQRVLTLIEQAIDSGKDHVEITPERVAPEATTKDLNGITGVVSQFTTHFPAYQSNRNHNIYTAVKYLDGIVIPPGKEFSYNETVGRRSIASGFNIAPVLVKGKKVPGVGGGICQVSSTLYNAALLADLKITARTHHSIPVHYIIAGRDATVDYGNLDLRFINPTDKPIALSLTAAHGTVTARVLGVPMPNREVKIHVTGMRRVGTEIQRVPDSHLLRGHTRVEEPGSGGRRCTTYRYVYLDGKLVKKERLSTDFYRPHPRIIAYGTRTSHPKTKSAPKIVPSAVDASPNDDIPQTPTTTP